MWWRRREVGQRNGEKDGEDREVVVVHNYRESLVVKMATRDLESGAT